MQYTGKGDEGYTSLYGGERVTKDSPRIETLGALDEATSAIGLARALLTRREFSAILQRVQHELYLLMAEIATTQADRLSQHIDATAVSALEADLVSLAKSTSLTQQFILPGDTRSGAALDMARAITRRAERHVVHLVQLKEVRNGQLTRYLNRLSSLLYVLARAEDQAGT